MNKVEEGIVLQFRQVDGVWQVCSKKHSFILMGTIREGIATPYVFVPAINAPLVSEDLYDIREFLHKLTAKVSN